MNILDKFSSVEIKADNRISAEDKAFCALQQESFDKAGPALQRIAEAMTAARKIKLFKNRRVDIKFDSSVSVQEFTETYLRKRIE